MGTWGHSYRGSVHALVPDVDSPKLQRIQWPAKSVLLLCCSTWRELEQSDGSDPFAANTKRFQHNQPYCLNHTNSQPLNDEILKLCMKTLITSSCRVPGTRAQPAFGQFKLIHRLFILLSPSLVELFLRKFLRSIWCSCTTLLYSRRSPSTVTPSY